MAPKTPAKTPVPLRTPKHGKGKLRVGGSNGGAGGRPPDEFRAEMARLASRQQLIEKLEEILKDSSHPFFIQAMKHVTEHGYGKPKETVEKTGGTDNSLTVRFVHE